MRRTIQQESETVARRILRQLRPKVAPSTYEVAYVATELRMFRVGRRMMAVPAFDRKVVAKGLDPTTRAAFILASVRKRHTP